MMSEAPVKKLKVVETMAEEVEEVESILSKFAQIVLNEKELSPDHCICENHAHEHDRDYTVIRVVERRDNYVVIEMESEGEEQPTYTDQFNVFFEHVRRVREI